MNSRSFVFALFSLLSLSTMAAPQEKLATRPSPLTFAGVNFFHRWVKNDQNEYTPKGQENLEHWSDMITINYYRSVKDGDGLASVANTVLENYKAHGATIVKIDSVPRTPQKPAEHLIVVYFIESNFIEATFTRFVIVDGVGTSHIYCHREWGPKARNQMDIWLKQKGQLMEKEIMGFKPVSLAKL